MENIEEFKKKGINIQTITTDELNEEYSQMIKLHQKYLYNKIVDTINQYIRGMSATEIESLIDRYLLTDIKYRGKQTISRLNDELQIAFVETLKIAKNSDQNQLLRTYLEKITPPLRKNKMDWLYEITNQFSKHLMQKIDLYFASFKSISTNNVDRTIENLNKAITEVMKQYQYKFDEDYQVILKKFLNNNKNQINELIHNLNNNKTPNFQIYSAIAELSNYQLIEESGTLYIKEKNTEEKIELTFKDGLLSSKDNKHRYHIDNEKQRLGYYNSESKVTILVHDGLITIIPPFKNIEDKYLISFAKNGHNYQLYYNLKPTNDLEKIESMIKEIEKYTPGIYNKLISDYNFEKLLIQIKNNNNTDTQNQQEAAQSNQFTESSNDETDKKVKKLQ